MEWFRECSLERPSCTSVYLTKLNLIRQNGPKYPCLGQQAVMSFLGGFVTFFAVCWT